LTRSLRATDGNKDKRGCARSGTGLGWWRTRDHREAVERLKPLLEKGLLLPVFLLLGIIFAVRSSPLRPHLEIHATVHARHHKLQRDGHDLLHEALVVLHHSRSLLRKFHHQFHRQPARCRLEIGIYGNVPEHSGCQVSQVWLEKTNVHVGDLQQRIHSRPSRNFSQFRLGQRPSCTQTGWRLRSDAEPAPDAAEHVREQRLERLHFFRRIAAPEVGRHSLHSRHLDLCMLVPHASVSNWSGCNQGCLEQRLDARKLLLDLRVHRPREQRKNVIAHLPLHPSAPATHFKHRRNKLRPPTVRLPHMVREPSYHIGDFPRDACRLFSLQARKKLLLCNRLCVHRQMLPCL